MLEKQSASLSTAPGPAAAIQDFRTARRQAAMQRILARLSGQPADLLSFEEVQQKLRPLGAAAQGRQEIPLDAIVGSVGRYADFTRTFLPRRDEDQDRWVRVRMAAERPGGLPPIEVYQVGEAYFVLDGNHRVSVARQLGVTRIEAYVTKIQTRVPLSPEDRPDDLIVKAEYAEFLEHTRLNELLPGAVLQVTAPGGYPRLELHIEVQHFQLETELGAGIPYEQAVQHWYHEVYLPTVELIREQGILQEYPERTEADLYLWLTAHRVALMKELDWAIAPEAALSDLAAQGRPARRRGISSVRERASRQLAASPPPGRRREEQQAKDTDRLFGDILVAVSSERAGWIALDQALAVARREGSRLRGLHVAASQGALRGKKRQDLQAEFQRRCAEADVTGEFALAHGKIAGTISERARWCDLVVVNLAHPPGRRPIARLNSGFRSLVQRSPKPVLAAPGRWTPLDSALLAYDGSPKAQEALFVSAYLAGRWGIPLTVLAVNEGGRPVTEWLEAASHYLRDHGVQAGYTEEHGPVGETILRVAAERQIELIVMGGYGLHPVMELALGSAVDQVLRESRIPVLICR